MDLIHPVDETLSATMKHIDQTALIVKTKDN